MADKPTVAIDFDGVLHQYTGWKGADALDDPMPGAQEFLVELVGRGYRVVVHTTRPAKYVDPWLQQYHMDDLVDLVTDKKVPAIAYVDDRAVRFWGEWAEVLTLIEQPPWWKRVGGS